MCSNTAITGEYLTGLATRLDAMLGRLRRIHFKSLGGLLTCQERLALEWAEQTLPEAVAVVDDEPEPIPVPAAPVAAQRVANAV